MTDSPALGQQLVVMHETALCDRLQHEVHLVTDGGTAYAWGGATDVAAVVREAAHRYEGTCGQPSGPGGEDADPCEGRVEWDTSSDTCWTSDPEVLRLLFRHGQTVERGDGLGDGL